MRTSTCRKEACQGCGSTKWKWRQGNRAPKPNTCSVCEAVPPQERCESCASEADIRIHGVCVGCLAYSLEPVRMLLDPALENDVEAVTVPTSYLAAIIDAHDKWWAALKPERLK